MIVSIFCCIFVLLLLSSLIWWFLLYRKWLNYSSKQLEKISGPNELPILGNFFVLWGSRAEMWKNMRKCAKVFNGRYKLRMLHIIAVNFSKPDDIEVLLKSATQIQKGFIYFLIKPWLQEGLLTSAGDYWRLRRKMLTPAFHFTILKQFANIFEENGKIIVKKLLNECKKESTDVMEYVTDYALHTLCDTTLGCKFESQNTEFNNYKKALHASFTSNIITLRLNNWDGSVAKNSCSETSGGKKLYSMLDLLIMRMKTNGDIDQKGIQEEVDTFVFEGHDTTSVAIVNMAMLLANNPEVQDKVVQELQCVIGKDCTEISYGNLQSLPYLEMCIKETLRMFPSVPFIARTITEPLELKDGVVLPNDLLCCVHIYDLHHNPEHWPEPEKFIPERFTEENCAKRHPFAYIPFSAGPRNCIGQKFAILQMKSIFANILLNYVLEPIDTPKSITMLVDLVFRTKDPIRIKFRQRVK